jgi:hypothetical protein
MCRSTWGHGQALLGQVVGNTQFYGRARLVRRIGDGLLRDFQRAAWQAFIEGQVAFDPREHQ